MKGKKSDNKKKKIARPKYKLKAYPGYQLDAFVI